MDNKDIYRELCLKEKSIPIFLKDWWLDAVMADGEWDVIIEKKGDNIRAALPFYYKKKYGFKFITQPILTQKTGIWINYPDNQGHSRKLSYEKEIMNEIIKELDGIKIDSYKQHFDYNITNWLPFYWNGYKQTTRYTYIIKDISNVDDVYNQFHSSKKKNIKKSQTLVKLKYDLSAYDFYNNHKMTLEKQGEKISYSFDVFEKIYNACYERNSGKTFYTVDEIGNIHCALFIVWDDLSAYDLISTIDPDYRNIGAASLVVLEAIKYVSKYTKKFDFEGSMIENVENSFRKFGAVQTPYFCIYKDKSKMFRLGKIIRDIIT